MNQGGWTFKDFMIILCIIMFSALIASVLYKKSVSTLFTGESASKADDRSYTDLERILKTSAERYQNTYYQTRFDSNETLVLSYKFLRNEGFIKDKIMDIKDNKTECNGYVLFEKSGASIKYYPYLKCGSNYETEGYISAYAKK